MTKPHRPPSPFPHLDPDSVRPVPSINQSLNQDPEGVAAKGHHGGTLVKTETTATKRNHFKSPHISWSDYNKKGSMSAPLMAQLAPNTQPQHGLKDDKVMTEFQLPPHIRRSQKDLDKLFTLQNIRSVLLSDGQTQPKSSRDSDQGSSVITTSSDGLNDVSDLCIGEPAVPLAVQMERVAEWYADVRAAEDSSDEVEDAEQNNKGKGKGKGKGKLKLSKKEAHRQAEKTRLEAEEQRLIQLGKDMAEYFKKHPVE